MITKTVHRSVQSNVPAGDSRQFGMDLDGKAFRILFDGIYSNKIGTPIREYLANGYDSHVVAGCPDRPVQVTLPSILEPTFSIRDFGVGLSHETVMDLYSTMFRSTKSGSNAEVGAFGLGSKSAFAYTDTFTVSSYFDGRKRVYHAVIGVDDIPTITELVELAEDCDETGFEVTIPVKSADVATFVHEYTKVAEGFDVKPICNLDVAIPEPILSGDGWRLYPRSHGYGVDYAVRQGCVIYPVNPYDAGMTERYPHGFSFGRLVVDVPIGAAEVAVSREALAFDDRTRKNVSTAILDAVESVRETLLANVHNASTLIEAMRARKVLNRFFNAAGNGISWNGRQLYDHLYFREMRFNRIGSRGSLEAAKNASFDIDESKSMLFIVDRGQPIVRRRIRLNDFKTVHGQSRVWVIDNPTNKQLSSFMRLLEIPSSHILSISAIPDPGPPARNATGAGTGIKPTGVYDKNRNRLVEAPETIDMWLPIRKGNSTSEQYLWGYHSPADGIGPFSTLAKTLGLDGTVHLLTPAAEKRYGATISTRFDYVLADAVAEKSQEILDGVYDAMLKLRCSPLAERHNLLNATDSFRGGLTDVGDVLVNPYGGNYAYRKFLTDKLGHDTIESTKKEAEDRIEILSETFPLLFDRSDDAAMTEYINSRKRNLK